MISGNNGVHCFSGLVVLRPSCGLVRDILDRVRITLARHREIHCHGGVRHHQSHVLAVVISVTDAGDCADNLKRYAVDKDSAADDGPTWKQDAHELAANDTDVVALLFIDPVDPTPLANWLPPNVIELWLGTINVTVAAAKLTHQAKVSTINNRRGIADVRRTTDVEIVLIVQIVLPRRKLTAAERGHASVVDLHVIFAKAGQAFLGSGAETLAESDKEEKRANSPGDPKHSEEGAELVRPHRAQYLDKTVKKSPHTLMYEHFAGEVPLHFEACRAVMRLFEMCNRTSVIGITKGERII